MIKKEKLKERDWPLTFDDLDTGEGLDFSTGTPMPNGEVKVKFFYSNNISPLIVNIANMKRTLNVSYSSVTQDNEQLLHHLFNKTRN